MNPFYVLLLIFLLISSSSAREEGSGNSIMSTDDELLVSEDETIDSTSLDANEPVDPDQIEEINDAQNLQELPKSDEQETTSSQIQPPVQSGPLIDLLGPYVLSLEMIDETHAQLQPHYTTDALKGKKVIGLYFSADWCGPCRQFTPELVKFYQKINSRRGKTDEFEIVWISRCRDTQSFGQYFTQMGGWYALPPEEAMGQRGQMLSNRYGVKSIPTLVLLDDLGNVITTDARNKIPQDKAGIGFPWRNPLATLYMTVLPRSLRVMIKTQIGSVRDQLVQRVKTILGLKRPSIA